MTQANIQDKISNYIELSESIESSRVENRDSDSDSTELISMHRKKRVIKLPREFRPYKRLFKKYL